MSILSWHLIPSSNPSSRDPLTFLINVGHSLKAQAQVSVQEPTSACSSGAAGGDVRSAA